MRTPTYLSPTSIMLWGKDRMEFYRKYLAEDRVPRMPQTSAMSVGSAFDAYIKNYLATCLGMPDANGDLDLDFLLTEQVEVGNRDFAFAAGLDCFNQYKKLGATAELIKELERSDGVSFEHTVQATVNDIVPLLGKPDLYYWADGVLHIYDWKVNGYCSQRGASPRKGYVRLLTSGKPAKVHKDARPVEGVCVVNNLEDLDVSWATQLCIYAWVLGGFDCSMVAGIDQLACKPTPSGVSIRVAALRNRIGSDFAANLWAQCLTIWERISVGEIFDSENESTMASLDTEAAAYVTDGGAWEDWYTTSMRSHKY